MAGELALDRLAHEITRMLAIDDMHQRRSAAAWSRGSSLCSGRLASIEVLARPLMTVRRTSFYRPDNQSCSHWINTPG